MITPRKHFSQNFLRDSQVIADIVAAIALNPNDIVLEIGPGLGALTLPLLQQCHKVIAIERDPSLIPELQKRTQNIGQLELLQGDALQTDLTTLAGPFSLRLVGNLPYHISTPLLFHFLAHKTVLRDIHVMLQGEVVDRLSAKPGNKIYGRLSVMVQYACEVTPILQVPAQAFWPAPKVSSAVVRLEPYKKISYPAENPVLFATLVAHAFGQRRKTLRNALRELVSNEYWPQLPADSNARAETLSVAEFVDLSNALYQILK